ncbi:hypothetical protein [Mesorhizobium sp. AR07]|uniref:hypothetical protein n=1 Tax=Mesorhizobium sp. AR07 TaxID=2865838 RepID=UPI0029E7FA65|nr:hypothetical protein [Mesorhizobium sp. AR07]
MPGLNVLTLPLSDDTTWEQATLIVSCRSPMNATVFSKTGYVTIHARGFLPWVSQKWKDDAWAVAQICGRDDRLSVEQVRAIRELARIPPAKTIAERIGARNREQVQRVIDGETYTRVI